MRTSAWTNIDLFALYVFVSLHHKYVFDCRQVHLNTFCWILILTYAKFMVIFCSHIHWKNLFAQWRCFHPRWSSRNCCPPPSPASCQKGDVEWDFLRTVQLLAQDDEGAEDDHHNEDGAGCPRRRPIRLAVGRAPLWGR